MGKLSGQLVYVDKKALQHHSDVCFPVTNFRSATGSLWRQYDFDKQDEQRRGETFPELSAKKMNADRLCDMQRAEFL